MSRKKREAKREERRRQQQQIMLIGGGLVIVAVILVGGAIIAAANRDAQIAANATATFEARSELQTQVAIETNQAAPPTTTPVPDEGPQPDLISLEEAARWEAPPAMDIDPDKYDYQAILKTEKGDIVVDLFEDESPLTVNNFVFLAREGYYDDTMFHRVLEGFMAQGGDPTGTGQGGPGYVFQDETDNDLTFDRPGLLAMANSGANTNGSQFFITYVATDWLNGKHTIFGEVVEGMDVAESLTLRDPNENPTFNGDTLLTVEIVEEPVDQEADEATEDE